jgi:hypothetical protein
MFKEEADMSILHFGYNDFYHTKSVVNDGLAEIFTDVVFEEINLELDDYVSDIDYVADIRDRTIGIQIKSVTEESEIENYSATERMRACLKAFEEEFGGKVFVVFSLDGEIANRDVVVEIETEINRLRGLLK